MGSQLCGLIYDLFFYKAKLRPSCEIRKKCLIFSDNNKKWALNSMVCALLHYVLCRLWQYGSWSFQTGGTKLERFLPKKQGTQRKLLNFENWVNWELSKSAKI